MCGHDLELCNEALDATTEVLGYKPKHIPKIVETIWAEAQNYIVMTNFPTTDKDMEMMRLQETLMQNIIKLDERARLAQPGERDEYHTGKFNKNQGFCALGATFIIVMVKKLVSVCAQHCISNRASVSESQRHCTRVCRDLRLRIGFSRSLQVVN